MSIRLGLVLSAGLCLAHIAVVSYKDPTLSSEQQSFFSNNRKAYCLQHGYEYHEIGTFAECHRLKAITAPWVLFMAPTSFFSNPTLVFDQHLTTCFSGCASVNLEQRRVSANQFFLQLQHLPTLLLFLETQIRWYGLTHFNDIEIKLSQFLTKHHLSTMLIASIPRMLNAEYHSHYPYSDGVVFTKYKPGDYICYVHPSEVHGIALNAIPLGSENTLENIVQKFGWNVVGQQGNIQNVALFLLDWNQFIHSRHMKM